MLLIDDRIGSRHYHDILQSQNIPSTLCRLDSADVCFEGNGVTVGVEVKKVLDAVSCLYSGRLADHQIPLMRAQYDVVYLVIEGLWRPGPEGVLQYWKWFESSKGVQCGRWADASAGQKRLMYTSFEQWLSTLELQGGVRLRGTVDSGATAGLLVSLLNWWQRDDHKSFRVMQDVLGDGAELSRPAMLRRIIALLPRIGWQRSGILAKRFKSVRELVEAPPSAWYIEGEVAEGTAARIVAALNGEGQ